MRGGSVFKTRYALICALLLPVSALALDPTQPPRALAPAVTGQGEALVPLRLQAIVRTSQAAQAVINGQSLRVGQRVDGARVLAIHSRSVLIERQGRRELLKLVAPLITPSRNPS